MELCHCKPEKHGEGEKKRVFGGLQGANMHSIYIEGKKVITPC